MDTSNASTERQIAQPAFIPSNGPPQGGISRLQDPKWLAAALIAYEADEPHVDLPDCKMDMVRYYPPIEPDELEEWRHQEHMGDCTNQPCACVRCAGEMAYHKAEWLIQKAAEGE